ncbi:hypothetical protein PanWU01x14_345650 [Parasponia andersonii]|uniref:Uncharacterized protein n=1 Tax=Parasponia andersonii TaxID=3476 RepID=A0A2P5ACJ1_PARAD|nr:hypothetical protein PanWU01x14_345650 [Parasponia andersonii]
MTAAILTIAMTSALFTIAMTTFLFTIVMTASLFTIIMTADLFTSIHTYINTLFFTIFWRITKVSLSLKMRIERELQNVAKYFFITTLSSLHIGEDGSMFPNCENG